MTKSKETTFTWCERSAANQAKAAAAAKRAYRFGPGPALRKSYSPWTLAKMAKLQQKMLASGALRYVEPNPFATAACA